MAAKRTSKKAPAKTKPKRAKKTAAQTQPVSSLLPEATIDAKTVAILNHAFVIVCGLLVVIIASGLLLSIRNLTMSQSDPAALLVHNSRLSVQLHQLKSRAATLRQAENAAEIQVVDPRQLDAALTGIQASLDAGDGRTAKKQIDTLRKQLAGWQDELNTKLSNQLAAASQTASGPQVPILLYHHPPANFEAQLQHLMQHGYTTITPDILASALQNHAPLPPKPVIITFDDGFVTQMSAFHSLQKYNMKATYYIIDAGEHSRWCIGAGRRYNDPLQPPQGCGDGYMSWDQVRELDQSGLITIASHTVDHENLALQSAAEQRFQIAEGKAELETQLGHPVRHFAYPYGAYSGLTVALVREAGFVTAVTTHPGTAQSLGSILTMPRVRDALLLP